MSGRLGSWIDRWGPTIVSLSVAALALAYLADAVRGSTRLHNLIMLAPLVALAVLLAVIVVVQQGRASGDAAPDFAPTASGEPGSPPETGQGRLGASSGAVASMMAALIAYAGLSSYIGFDVASILFMAFCLVVQGERRWLLVVGFSVAYALGISWLLITVARVALPTLLL